MKPLMKVRGQRDWSWIDEFGNAEERAVVAIFTKHGGTVIAAVEDVDDLGADLGTCDAGHARRLVANRGQSPFSAASSPAAYRH